MDQIRVQTMESDDDVLATWEVMRQLRPHIAEENYLPTVRRMMQSDGYRLTAVVQDGRVSAVAGYRFMEMLYCGRILSVDDLITDAHSRSRGHGKRLLDWLIALARTRGCDELHLDSGVQREHAHRFYFREGLTVNAFHFRTRV